MATGHKLEGELNLAEIPTPATPSSGRNLIYPKSDKKWYQKDSDGVESLLTNVDTGNAAIRIFKVNNFR